MEYTVGPRCRLRLNVSSLDVFSITALDVCHLPVPVPVREKVTPSIFLFYVTHDETFRVKGGEEPEVEVYSSPPYFLEINSSWSLRTINKTGLIKTV